MNVQLKRYEFTRLHSNKAKLKHPNVTELLCVCVYEQPHEWVSIALGRTAAYSSCLSHMWNDSHTHGWMFSSSKYLYSLPTYTSPPLQTTTSPQWRKAGVFNIPLKLYIFHWKQRSFRAIMATNKYPWFSSSHTLKIPIQKNAHLPVFFFSPPSVFILRRTLFGLRKRIIVPLRLRYTSTDRAATPHGIQLAQET